MAGGQASTTLFYNSFTFLLLVDDNQYPAICVNGDILNRENHVSRHVTASGGKWPARPPAALCAALWAGSTSRSDVGRPLGA